MAVGVDVSRQIGVGRRAWLQGGLALGAAALAGWPGREVLAAHGMAWGGEPRYPESFAHFDYVRPDAPRGGLVRLAGMGTFDCSDGQGPRASAGWTCPPGVAP